MKNELSEKVTKNKIFYNNFECLGQILPKGHAAN